MALNKYLPILTGDHVRMVQVFMLFRLSGVLLSTIVVARLLSIEEVGILEMLIFCGFLMTFFWSDAFVKAFLAKKDVTGFNYNAGNFLLIYFLLGLISMSLLIAAKQCLVPFFTDRKDLPGLALFAIYQALVIPLWMVPFLNVLKKHITPLLAMYVLIGPSFSCWAGFQSLPGINGVLIGLLSYALVGFVWVLTQVKFSGQIIFFRFLRVLWPFTWPLILYTVSATLARSIDAWLVAHYFDETTFAIFRYGAKEFPLVVALGTGLSTSMIARLVNLETIPELRERSKRLMNICYPVIAILLLFSPALFVFFYGAAYKMSALIFNIYLLLTLTQLFFPQTILIAKGDSRLLWGISLAELAVNVSASLLLMKSFGYAGIAWGTLIAFVFEKIVLLIAVYKRYGIKPGSLFHGRHLFSYSVLLIIAFIISKWAFGL